MKAPREAGTFNISILLKIQNDKYIKTGINLAKDCDNSNNNKVW